MGGVGLVFVGALGMFSTVAGAQAGGTGGEDTTTFTVIADAQVASNRVTLPGAGLVIGEEVANVSPARANTRLDSIGTSSAYAAAGYPGDTLLSGPGTVVGVLSGYDGIKEVLPLLPPAPGYPLLARSDTLNPTVSNQAGAYKLEASTEGGESVAEALVGADESGITASSMRATSHTTYDAGTHTAAGEAVAETNGARIANLLDISQRTTGTISVSPGAPPSITTSTFFGVSVVGSTIQVGFGPGGFQLLTGNPIERVVLDSLLASLANQQVTVDYVPEQRADDGSSVTSAGMRITSRTATPDMGDVVNTITLGQVTLAAEAGALPLEEFGSGGSTAPTLGGGGGGGSAAAAPRPSAGSTGSGATSGSPPAGASSTARPAPVAQPGASGGQPGSGHPLTLSSSTFYLVLVGGGLAALGSSRLLGTLAVRLRLGTVH